MDFSDVVGAGWVGAAYLRRQPRFYFCIFAKWRFDVVWVRPVCFGVWDGRGAPKAVAALVVNPLSGN